MVNTLFIICIFGMSILLCIGTFIFLIRLTNPNKPEQLYTEDVIDDDIDDAYYANDWTDVEWDKNSFNENEFEDL